MSPWALARGFLSYRGLFLQLSVSLIAAASDLQQQSVFSRRSAPRRKP